MDRRDVTRDGFAYELWDRGVEPTRLVMWVIEDAAGKVTFAGSGDSVPLKTVEALLERVRRDRPPKS